MEITSKLIPAISGIHLEWMISNLTINSKPINIWLFVFLLWSITVSLLKFHLPMINLIRLEYLTSLMRWPFHFEYYLFSGKNSIRIKCNMDCDLIFYSYIRFNDGIIQVKLPTTTNYWTLLKFYGLTFQYPWNMITFKA